MLQRCQLRSSFIAMTAALLLAMPICAHAGSAPKVTTTLRVARTGSFFLNTGDRLVVQAIPPTPIIPPIPIRVHVNMAGVTGIGRTSGQHFVLNGSQNFEADGDVPTTLNLQGTYRLQPTPPPISQNPQPPPIVPISFTVQNGIATSALATVGECTTDLGCGD